MSLQVRKLDLHVHTPASHDFRDKSVTPEQIVNKAIAEGLDGLAIADHNSAGAIDEIKPVAKAKGLTIFPGIEVSCVGGEEGVLHVLGIFDTDKSKADLDQVRGALGIKGEGKNSFTPKSIADVINGIRSLGGIPILAHANSSHGAFADIRGNPKTDILKNPNLLGVEATKTDFQKEAGKRLIDLLDGRNPRYSRKLAVYRASDNMSTDNSGHCLDTIGSSFTYFRMGVLNLESLRQCFEDPDTRIIQSYEEDKLKLVHPRILEVSISGGFLDGQRFPFHTGMNSIIGGTGTGKSLLIEFLRFAFDKKPQHLSLVKENLLKLEKQLGAGNSIKVLFRDAAGYEYELERVYEPSRDPYGVKTKCTNKKTSEEFMGDIASIFPLLIYSQNEILEITRDPRAQLKLLDDFRDFEKLQTRIAEVKDNLERNDHKLLELVNLVSNETALIGRRSGLGEKIKKLGKQLESKVPTGLFDTYEKLSQAKEDALSKIEEYDRLIKPLDVSIEELRRRIILSSSASKSTYPLSRKILLGHRKVGTYLIAELDRLKGIVKRTKETTVKELELWEKKNKFSAVEQKYNKALQTMKQEKAAEATRKALNKELNEVNSKITESKETQRLIGETRKERRLLLEEFLKIRKAYFGERYQQAEQITTRSGGKLHIDVIPASDSDIYKKQLQTLKVGSYVEEKDIDSIIEKISPSDLVESILDGKIDEIFKVTGIAESTAENLVQELQKKENMPAVLSMQYRSSPEDKIEIAYRKSDGKYYPLDELSMGQKADALMMIALGDSTMPVIIDQPEDALDIPSIWDGICSRLRISKHIRQFIFTTHNSSIAVSSDSDQYIVLEAEATHGKIGQIGSIDEEHIKKKVIDHLEGGLDSYTLKRKKYHL